VCYVASHAFTLSCCFLHFVQASTLNVAEQVLSCIDILDALISGKYVSGFVEVNAQTTFYMFSMVDAVSGPLMILFIMTVVLWSVPVRGLDINCANVTPPLLLDASTAPFVRILNCSQRIAVTVPCGVDVDHPMVVEVVGGTTVPMLTLSQCEVNGVSGGFAFVALTINGVVMQQNSSETTTPQQSGGPVDAIAPLSATLLGLPRSSAITFVTIRVVGSRLLWVTTPLSSAGQLANFDVDSHIQNVSISVSLSTLVVWSINTDCHLVALRSTISEHVSVSFARSTIAMTMTDYDGTRSCVVSVLSDIADEMHVTIADSAVSITGDELRSAYFLSRFASSAVQVGSFARTSQTVTNTNVTVVARSSFFLVAAPQVNALTLSHSYFAVIGCRVWILFQVVDGTMATSASLFLVFSAAVSNVDVLLEVSGVDVLVIKNTSSLSKDPSPYPYFSMGIIGLVYNANSNMSRSQILILDSVIAIEEVGAHIVALYRPAALFGVDIGIVTVTYSLYLSAATLLTSCSVLIANSSLDVRRSAAEDGDRDAIIYVAPRVQ
jgi:hypothetical protein